METSPYYNFWVRIVNNKKNNNKTNEIRRDNKRWNEMFPMFFLVGGGGLTNINTRAFYFYELFSSSSWLIEYFTSAVASEKAKFSPDL